MSMDTNDLRGYCRICLEEPQKAQLMDMHMVYDKDTQLTYYDCYEICTNEDLRRSKDNEPYTLCKHCIVELQWAYDFYKKFSRAKEQLQELCNVRLSKQNKQLPPPSQAQNEEEIVIEMQLVSPEEAQMLSITDEQLFEEGAADSETEEHLQFELLDENDGKDSMEDIQFIETKYCGSTTESETELSAPIEIITIAPASAEDIAPRLRHAGEYICPYCNSKFRNRSRMIKHQLIHQSDRPLFRCNHCDRMYQTKQALKNHEVCKHEQKGHVCHVCGKVYAVSKALELHMRYHTGDFPFACDQCERKFAQRSHLNVHKQVKHKSARFICVYPDCGKYFTSSASLRNHECVHSQMPFVCLYCQHGFPSRSKLRIHIRNKHGKDTTLEQLECMRKFFVARSKLVLAKVDTSRKHPAIKK